MSSNVQVAEYVNVKEKTAALGMKMPDGLVLLPSYFESAQTKKDLYYPDSVDTVRKLLRQGGITVAKMEDEDQKFPREVYHAIEWIGPAILFTVAAVTQNPAVVSITLGVISNYLSDWFRGIPKDRRSVRLIFVKETKDGAYKKLDFHGPPDSLKDVKAILDGLDDEKKS